MAIIGWIVFGLVVGALARLLMPGEQPMGCLLTILLRSWRFLCWRLHWHSTLWSSDGVSTARWLDRCHSRRALIAVHLRPVRQKKSLIRRSRLSGHFASLHAWWGTDPTSSRVGIEFVGRSGEPSRTCNTPSKAGGSPDRPQCPGSWSVPLGSRHLLSDAHAQVAVFLDH